MKIRKVIAFTSLASVALLGACSSDSEEPTASEGASPTTSEEVSIDGETTGEATEDSTTDVEVETTEPTEEQTDASEGDRSVRNVDSATDREQMVDNFWASYLADMEEMGADVDSMGEIEPLIKEAYSCALDEVFDQLSPEGQAVLQADVVDPSLMSEADSMLISQSFDKCANELTGATGME